MNRVIAKTAGIESIANIKSVDSIKINVINATVAYLFLPIFTKK